MLEKSNFTHGANQGVKIVAPLLFWFIEGADKRILVDSGGSDPQWAARYHHPIDRMVHEEPLNAVADLGLKPEDIDIIINDYARLNGIRRGCEGGQSRKLSLSAGCLLDRDVQMKNRLSARRTMNGLHGWNYGFYRIVND
jgi:hypothetical protein